MKVALLLVLVLLSFSGCSSKTKETLYEEGEKQLQAGNPAAAVVYFKNALEKDVNYYDARLQLAKAYAALGKNEQAEKEFNKVLTQNPSRDEVLLELARLYNVMDKGDQGYALGEKYLARHPGDAQGLEVLGSACAARGRHQEALGFLNRALAADPRRPGTKLQLASVHLSLGQLDRARPLLNEVVQADQKNFKALFMLASLEMRGGNVDKAAAWYRKVLQLDPSRTDAGYKLGIIQVEKGQLAEAEAAADRMVQQYPKKGEGYRLKGVVSFYRKKYDDAITALQQSIKLGPTLDGYQFLGLAYYSRGELENALSQFRVILDRIPSSSHARLMTAQTLLAQNRTEDGIAEINKVLADDDTDAMAHNLLGTAYLKQGLFDEGMHELDLATKLDPKLVQAHLKKGAFYFSRGRAAEGEAELTMAVRAVPDAMNSRLLLASHYRRQGKLDKAITVVKGGLQGGKGDAALYNALASLQFASGDGGAAMKSLDEAKRVNPLFAATYLNLAGYYAARADYGRAASELTELLKHSPGNLRALFGLASLSEITGRESDALSYYQKAKETRSPEAYLALSAYYQKKKAPARALEVLDEALRLDPRSLTLLEAKGALLLAQKEYRNALKCAEELEALDAERGVALKIRAYLAMKEGGKAVQQAKSLIARHPHSAKGHLVLAGVYRATGDIASAIDQGNQAVKAEPKSAQPRVVLGELYRARKDYSAAQGAFQEALKVQPGSVAAKFALASLLDATGKKREAAVRYRTIVEQNGSFVPALNNLAYLCAQGYGKKEEALRFSIAAFRLEPGNVGVMDTVGYALYRNGRGADAVKVLERTAALAPADPTVRYHLGLAYNQVGDRDKSKQALKESLALGEYPERQAAQALLAQLQR